MLKQVTFTNFRCLRSATLNLGPLTILVGPNACGKSSVLQALDPQIVFRQTDVWQRRPAEAAFVRRTRSDGTEVLTKLDGRTRGQQYVYQLLHLELGQLRQPNTLTEAQVLTRGGDNLTNLFATLTRPDQAKLSEKFCQLVPVFADVYTRPLDQGRHRLVFQDRWNDLAWYEPSEVSDGSMLVLAFLALQYQKPPVDVLAIEEPERGIHPFLLGKVLELLRDLSAGKLGPKKVQVVLATHSAQLLEFAQPEEVRFLSRSEEDGSVEIKETPTGTPEWRDAFEEYSRSLGSAWLSGGLGGVPAG